MKILLVSSNRCREPVPVLPLGAMLVAEAAEAAGHRVRLLDLMFAADPVAELGRTLREFAPQVVGLSVRNLDNTTMQQPENFVPELLPLLQIVRQENRPVIVLGGAAVGIAPETLLRFTGADWAVTGAGDDVFPRLLDLLATGRHPTRLPGLAWLEEAGFQHNRPTWPADHPFRFPALERWVDLRPYRRQGSAIPLQSKRGCAFACTYCPCPQIEGKVYRLAPPEQVAAEIDRLAATGVRDLEFIDTVFNAPYEHARALCQAIRRRRPPVRLHTFELNPAFVDRPLLTEMEEAGFAAVGLTAESAAAEVLAGLGKNYRPEDLDRAAAALRHSRLPCLWIFMLGGPGETPATVARTLRFASERLRSQDIAFFTVGVRVYPGTELVRQACREGVLRGGEELLAPTFYLSPKVEAAALRRQVRAAVAADPRFLTFGMDSLRYLPAIRTLAGRLGLAPPLWRHTARIRRGLGWLGVHETID